MTRTVLGAVHNATDTITTLATTSEIHYSRASSGSALVTFTSTYIVPEVIVPPTFDNILANGRSVFWLDRTGGLPMKPNP